MPDPTIEQLQEAAGEIGEQLADNLATKVEEALAGYPVPRDAGRVHGAIARLAALRLVSWAEQREGGDHAAAE